MNELSAHLYVKHHNEKYNKIIHFFNIIYVTFILLNKYIMHVISLHCQQKMKQIFIPPILLISTELTFLTLLISKLN